MLKKRARIFIRGKVQGVFFRQSLKTIAKKNNVNGIVKNTEDGRVEATAEGNYVDLLHLIEWCHIGPASSRVDHVEIIYEKYKKQFKTFDVLY